MLSALPFGSVVPHCARVKGFATLRLAWVGGTSYLFSAPTFAVALANFFHGQWLRLSGCGEDIRDVNSGPRGFFKILRHLALLRHYL